MEGFEYLGVMVTKKRKHIRKRYRNIKFCFISHEDEVKVLKSILNRHYSSLSVKYYNTFQYFNETRKG